MSVDQRSGAERAAIEWEVRLREPATDERALRAFRKWHDGAPEHAAAWASLQRRLGLMGGRSGSGGGIAVARALRHPVEERRRALRAAFGTAVLAISGTGGWKLAHELGYDATWRSGVGEHGAATLADGSALRFDAASRIDLGTGRGPMRLHLRQGQLLVRARRALTVTVAGADIDCDGAELCAGRLGRRGIVAVRGGSAVLRVPGVRAVELASGDTLTFDGAGALSSPLSFNAAAGWTRGMLVADRLPLPDLAEAFGRYHRGILRVSGAAAGHVISGVFRLADLDGALRQIAGALPVRVNRYGLLAIIE
ncbi:FecR family protein [Pseudoduganella albidiflava]|nr:DUF4880 domain-containing protein [Pseudoduganella albidiflava]GGY35480.1 sigma factor regulator FemR [Pseudoduganella albidiflava]